MRSDKSREELNTNDKVFDYDLPESVFTGSGAGRRTQRLYSNEDLETAMKDNLPAAEAPLSANEKVAMLLGGGAPAKAAAKPSAPATETVTRVKSETAPVPPAASAEAAQAAPAAPAVTVTETAPPAVTGTVPPAKPEAKAASGSKSKRSGKRRGKGGKEDDPKADLLRLSKKELLEIMVAQGEEIDRLRARIGELEASLADRELTFSKLGSIAEASLAVTDIFKEAEKAAKIYLDNARRMIDEKASRK